MDDAKKYFLNGMIPFSDPEQVSILLNGYSYQTYIFKYTIVSGWTDAPDGTPTKESELFLQVRSDPYIEENGEYVTPKQDEFHVLGPLFIRPKTMHYIQHPRTITGDYIDGILFNIGSPLKYDVRLLNVHRGLDPSGKEYPEGTPSTHILEGHSCPIAPYPISILPDLSIPTKVPGINYETSEEGGSKKTDSPDPNKKQTALIIFLWTDMKPEDRKHVEIFSEKGSLAKTPLDGYLEKLSKNRDDLYSRNPPSYGHPLSDKIGVWIKIPPLFRIPKRPNETRYFDVDMHLKNIINHGFFDYIITNNKVIKCEPVKEVKIVVSKDGKGVREWPDVKVPIPPPMKDDLLMEAIPGHYKSIDTPEITGIAPPPYSGPRFDEDDEFGFEKDGWMEKYKSIHGIDIPKSESGTGVATEEGQGEEQQPNYVQAIFDFVDNLPIGNVLDKKKRLLLSPSVMRAYEGKPPDLMLKEVMLKDLRFHESYNERLAASIHKNVVSLMQQIEDNWVYLSSIVSEGLMDRLNAIKKMIMIVLGSVLRSVKLTVGTDREKIASESYEKYALDDIEWVDSVIRGDVSFYSDSLPMQPISKK